MSKVGDIALKVRSKNAGPFWLTVDVFCGGPDAYARLNAVLDAARIAAVFGVNTQTLKRFEFPDLHVIKFSLPRPHIQGSAQDADMHGAAWASLVAELTV